MVDYCECPNTRDFYLYEGDSKTRCGITVKSVAHEQSAVMTEVTTPWGTVHKDILFQLGSYYYLEDGGEYERIEIKCTLLTETKSYFAVCYIKKAVPYPCACDIHRFPQSDLIMDEGDDVFIKLSVTNCGTGGQGNFFYKIKIDGTECATKYNALLYPGEDASEVLRCDVVMENSDIKIEQIGGHYNYDTATWDEDFHYEHHLKPRTYTLDISPTTHSSPYYGDSFEISVSSNTTWIVYDYESWIQFTPSSGDGNGSITVTVNENPGTASRTGSIYVTHDGMTRSCIITQAGAVSLTCDQPVKVVNKDTGAGIEGITVAARPATGTIIRCTTDSLGKCTLEGLIKGDDYILVVESYPEGWECQYTVDCEEDITACETERTFRLKWTAPLPCDQSVKVVDKDTDMGMEGITVAAWQNGAKVTDCATASDGKCSILNLNRDQMYDVIIETLPEGYECEYVEDCEYNMQMACDSEIVLKLHESEEPTKGKIEYISCTAIKEAENDYEITAVVTVKNTDTVNHKYRIKMYDSEGTHLDDEPDELDPKPEVAPGDTIDITLTTIGSIPNAKTTEILCKLYDIKIGADEFIVSETKQCSEVNIGKITNISCIYVKQGELEYEIEAIVEFKNPDTISHLYKVELLDGLTKESKDWNPGKLSAGKEVAAGTSSAITVSTTGLGYCSSPLILIKLWETTGLLAVADEQEYDCSAPEDEESIWKLIADILNMSVPQVKVIATAGGGLLALSFIMPLFRR